MRLKDRSDLEHGSVLSLIVSSDGRMRIEARAPRPGDVMFYNGGVEPLLVVDPDTQSRCGDGILHHASEADALGSDGWTLLRHRASGVRPGLGVPVAGETPRSTAATRTGVLARILTAVIHTAERPQATEQQRCSGQPPAAAHHLLGGDAGLQASACNGAHGCPALARGSNHPTECTDICIIGGDERRPLD